MSQIKAHTSLQLSSKSSGRWSKMKWVIGETGSSAPITGSTKMEAEDVLSCLGGWNSHGVVSNPCLFPQPPFHDYPPSPVSQRHVTWSIPNHIHFPPFSKPNCACPQYPPRCARKRWVISCFPTATPLRWRTPTCPNSNPWATLCWDVPWARDHSRWLVWNLSAHPHDNRMRYLSAYIVVKKYKLRKAKWLPGSESWIREFATYPMDFKTTALSMLSDCLQVRCFLLFLLHCLHCGTGSSL